MTAPYSESNSMVSTLLSKEFDQALHARTIGSKSEIIGDMIKFLVIDDHTGESLETNLIPETLIQGGGLIGRHPSCDIVLNSPEVSRVHGRIVYREGHYYFTDLGSTGGSQVNKEEASTNENFLLKPNDIIRIGGFILLVKEVKVNSDSPIHQPQEAPVLEVDPVQIEQLIFKAEELKAQGILNPSTSEFVFQGKLLEEGLSFSQRFRQKAIELCQAELDTGRFCLLVEHSDLVTIWQEKQVKKQENSPQSIPAGQAKILKWWIMNYELWIKQSCIYAWDLNEH